MYFRCAKAEQLELCELFLVMKEIGDHNGGMPAIKQWIDQDLIVVAPTYMCQQINHAITALENEGFCSIPPEVFKALTDVAITKDLDLNDFDSAVDDSNPQGYQIGKQGSNCIPAFTQFLLERIKYYESQRK